MVSEDLEYSAQVIWISFMVLLGCLYNKIIHRAVRQYSCDVIKWKLGEVMFLKVVFVYRAG